MSKKKIDLATAAKVMEAEAKMFDLIADVCDKWAADSIAGGWSTHQVDANREMANEMRRHSARIRVLCVELAAA